MAEYSLRLPGWPSSSEFITDCFVSHPRLSPVRCPVQKAPPIYIPNKTKKGETVCLTFFFKYPTTHNSESDTLLELGVGMGLVMNC